MISLPSFLAFALLVIGKAQASNNKVHAKPSFLRQLQTECDCSDYTDDVCLGYDYNGEGGSALPSNFAECGDVCCNCSCSAVTVELCVACLDAGVCNSFLTSCAQQCCILVSSAPAATPQKWGGWGSSGSWGGSSGGAKPPSKPKPAPKPKGGKYKSGGGAKKGKKSNYSSGGGSGGGGSYSSSWSGSGSSSSSHEDASSSSGSYAGRVAGDDAEGRVSGSDNSGYAVQETPALSSTGGFSSTTASASVASMSNVTESTTTYKIFGMSRTLFFAISALAASAIVAFAVGVIRQRSVQSANINVPLQEMSGLPQVKTDSQYVRSA